MFDNLEEYKDPDLYDAENDSFKDDFNIFVGLKSHGLALDLACGTGRLTIALAKSGLSCVGIDASKSMLERARNKSEGLAISYRQEDMRDFHLNQTFDLITLAGNAFQALLTDDDQERLLLCVRDHLKPDGIFAFNTRNPRPDVQQTTTDYEFWHDFRDPNGQVVKVYGKQSYDSSKNTVCYMTKRVWPGAETVSKIELRFTPLKALKQKLQALGFEVSNIYGDFYKNPYSRMSENIILVCRRK